MPDKERKHTQLSIEEQTRLNLQAALPVELSGMISAVKIGLNKEGKQEVIVTTCSWHNSKQNLSLLALSLPKEIMISHGMCKPCADEQNKLLDS
jgi:hypothetical protein